MNHEQCWFVSEGPRRGWRGTTVDRNSRGIDGFALSARPGEHVAPMSRPESARVVQLGGLLASLLAGGLVAPCARAEAGPDEHFRLATRGWRRSCPDPQELRREIAANLGRDPFDPSADKAVSVSIEADASGLGGTVEILGTQGEILGRRRIASSRRRCAELTRALALVVTLALDERARTENASATASGGGRVASTVVPAIQREAPLLSVPAGRRGPRWSLGLGGAAGWGSGPGFGAVGLIGLEARWRLWSFGLEAGFEDQTGTTVSGVRVFGLRGSATLSACGWPFRIAGVCALIATGEEHAQAEWLENARSADGPFLAGGLRVLAEVVRVDRLSLALNLDGLMPLVRAQFMLGGRTLWREPLGALELGLRVAFGL
jgi:hypothetical protein